MFKREFLGEFSGTFLLVLFGCGTVAVDTLFGAHVSLALIALFWGIGVTLSIYLTRHLCCAHLNPAVTMAMACSGRMTWKKVPTYLIAQFLGAFAAGWVIYLLFFTSIHITGEQFNAWFVIGRHMTEQLTQVQDFHCIL